MTRQRVRIDCEPQCVTPWRLEGVDGTVWITFGEDVSKPLGVVAEVVPAMRRFLDEIGDVGTIAAAR